MNYVSVTTWSLIAGFSLLIPFASVTAADQPERAARPGIATPTEPPATPPASEGHKGKPTPPSVERQNRPSAAADPPPRYIPRPGGTPGGREPGGRRPVEDKLPMLAVLAPDHTGLTVHEQPFLYWYLSESTTYPIVFTFRDNHATQPLLEVQLGAPTQPGVQGVRLADYGVRLPLNVQYRWYVALVVDPHGWSKNIIAGGMIERIEPPAEFLAKLAQAPRAYAPHVYAEAGLWYDALMAISDLIDAAPHDSVLRQQRAALLGQVGLPEIAEHDMRLSRAD